MESKKFEYNAFVERVIDGDTIEVTLDFGFGLKQEHVKFRLYGIDTPEIFGVKKDSPEYEKGMAAKDFLIQIEGREIVLRTIKDKKEKYGRYLAIVYLDGVDMNEALVLMGYASRYMV